MENETFVGIASVSDIITARERGRNIGKSLGFSPTDLTIIATIISEVARNILLYAKKGEIILETSNHGNRKGIIIIAKDNGPGIPDINLAMHDGFSTGKGLGLGLPGVRRLTDEFEIISEIGKGTIVTMRKWTM
jgi:serine/threonine-protein kinase RsbT